jgi:hypothetical protein
MRAIPFAAVVCLTLIRAAYAATPEQIDQSIKRARSFLLSQQHNGNW